LTQIKRKIEVNQTVSVKDRLKAEQSFHDRQALTRASDLEARPDSFLFSDDAYLDHETWIRPAMDHLGAVQGLRILDYGCGHGMAAVVFARHGARATAFDLSQGYLQEARKRAHANGVEIEFAQADGERLPFADEAFDRIWGNAVLHHLDVRLAGRELARVLRPGGIAVFCEPWGENPFLRWVRHRVQYASKERTPDEQPLRRKQVEVLREVFPTALLSGYQFLSMLRRVIPRGKLAASLDWCDEMLLDRIPVLQRYCRYIVLVLRKELV